MESQDEFGGEQGCAAGHHRTHRDEAVFFRGAVRERQDEGETGPEQASSGAFSSL